MLVSWTDASGGPKLNARLINVNGTNIGFEVANTVRSRYKRQLIRLNMKKKWPTRTGKEDSRPIFFCKRFSYNENALYAAHVSCHILIGLI